MSETHVESYEAPKASWIGKLLKWGITLVAVLILVNFITGLRSDQKDSFSKGVHTAAVQRCQADAACLASLEQKFQQCLQDFSESHKSGKFNRKYTLDEPGFYNCVR